jgi:hypothetical protein
VTFLSGLPQRRQGAKANVAGAMGCIGTELSFNLDAGKESLIIRLEVAGVSLREHYLSESPG